MGLPCPCTGWGWVHPDGGFTQEPLCHREPVSWAKNCPSGRHPAPTTRVLLLPGIEGSEALGLGFEQTLQTGLETALCPGGSPELRTAGGCLSPPPCSGPGNTVPHTGGLPVGRGGVMLQLPPFSRLAITLGRDRNSSIEEGYLLFPWAA